MNITNNIVLGIIIILFSIGFIIACIAEKDINRYTNILIKEIIIFFPIALLMFAYQIYKSGQIGMYGFIPVLFNLVGIFIILSKKILEVDRFHYSSSFSSKYAGAVGYFIVFIPLGTITSLIAMIFGIK
jgi:hypothetical protein